MGVPTETLSLNVLFYFLLLLLPMIAMTNVGGVFARTVESWKKLEVGVVGLYREFWVLLVGNKQHTSKKNKDPRSWVEVRGLSCGMMMRMMMIPHLLGMMMMMTMME
jgi:hypothetical protein